MLKRFCSEKNSYFNLLGFYRKCELKHFTSGFVEKIFGQTAEAAFCVTQVLLLLPFCVTQVLLLLPFCVTQVLLLLPFLVELSFHMFILGKFSPLPF